MIQGILQTYDGERYALPVSLEWTLHYTGGVPCDSFSFTTLYDCGMEGILRKAIRFQALEGETVMFYGVVDEYEIRCAGQGRLLQLSGRGMAALLLDNESERMTYPYPTLQEILRNHVQPYGIETGDCQSLSGQVEYVVSSGSSQWKALSGFTEFYGGFTPYFTKEGVLVLDGDRQGQQCSVTDESMVLSLSWREKRYGVLSEVLVIDKVQNLRQTVKNETFLAQGGCARRVLYMPGKSSYTAMRYTGEYQIRQSQQDQWQVELTLGGLFSAFPGDALWLNLSQLGLAGEFKVAEAENTFGEEGETCRLVLKER